MVKQFLVQWMPKHIKTTIIHKLGGYTVYDYITYGNKRYIDGVKDNNKTNKIIARCSTSFSLNGEQAKLYSYKRYEKFTTDLTATVRIENEEFKTNAGNSYLSGSKDESCLAYLREDSVNFILPKGVIYGVCYLTYICKPSKINLSLQSNCNLSDETMEEIVANTAQRLHGVIGTDNYEKYVKENVLIE